MKSALARDEWCTLDHGRLESSEPKVVSDGRHPFLHS